MALDELVLSTSIVGGVPGTDGQVLMIAEYNGKQTPAPGAMAP